MGFLAARLFLYHIFVLSFDLKTDIVFYKINMKERISDFHYLLYLFINSTPKHLPVTTQTLYKFKLLCSVFRLEFRENL